jgi:hypothetical protein
VFHVLYFCRHLFSFSGFDEPPIGRSGFNHQLTAAVLVDGDSRSDEMAHVVFEQGDGDFLQSARLPT